MPTLTKQYTLEITPEQYLKACSSNELQEISLILDTHVRMKSNSSRSFARHFEQFHTDVRKIVPSADYEMAKSELVSIKSHYRMAFLDFLTIGFTMASALKALEFVNEICENTTMSPGQIVSSMRSFQNLENQRKISLVMKAQLIAEPTDKI